MKSWFIPSAVKKNLQLAVHIGPDVPEFVRGDAVRIRQILFILAGNAVKFTEKGTVTLSLYKGEEQGDRTVLAFEVSDTGIGIPREDLEKIFVEFGQVAGGSFLKSNPGQVWLHPVRSRRR
jgi:signal transduction histidine kinase